MADPDLDAMLADLAANLAPGESVTLTVGNGSCPALHDDEEVLRPDQMGQIVQVTETVLRIRDGALAARPAVGSTVTTQQGSDAAISWIVGEVRKDPQNPGMLRLQVRRT